MLRTANTFYSHSDLSTCALDKRVKQLPLQGSSSKGLFFDWTQSVRYAFSRRATETDNR